MLRCFAFFFSFFSFQTRAKRFKSLCSFSFFYIFLLFFFPLHLFAPRASGLMGRESAFGARERVCLLWWQCQERPNIVSKET
jgi:hypothetical protein